MAASDWGGYGPAMDGASVSADDLNALRTYAEELADGDCAMLECLLPLIGPAGAMAQTAAGCDPRMARNLLSQAHQVLSDLGYALAPDGEVDPHRSVLWRHSERFPDPYKEQAWVPDEGALQDVAARYLSRPWMSWGHLEWVMVDALTRREIIAYEAHVATVVPAPGTLPWAIRKAFTSWIPLLVDAVAAGLSGWWLWSEFSTEAPHRWWWAAGIGAVYGWLLLTLPFKIPARVRARRARRAAMLATAERLRAMRQCYSELGAPVLDPTRL